MSPPPSLPRGPVTRWVSLLALTVALVLPAAAVPAASAATSAVPAGGTQVPSGVPAPPELQAASWLVADLDTGEVLAAHDARAPYAPASTLKLLTLLTLAPGLDREEVWTATHEDAAIDGSKVGMVPDSQYRVQDLLHGMMLGSGNDTAHALAGVVGGMDVATGRMQETADALGAQDTVVRNTSGLDADGQVSTALDLAVIGRAVLADPALAEVVATKTYTFPGAGTGFGGDRPSFEIANKNKLLYRYDGALGLKNGYTVAARSSFVGAVERDGHRYIATLLRAEGSASDQTRQLLDWAIANAADAEPVGTLPDGPAGGGQEAEPSAGPVDQAAGLLPDLGEPVPVDVGTGSALVLPAWMAVVIVLLGTLLAAVVLLRVRVVLRRGRGRGRRVARY